MALHRNFQLINGNNVTYELSSNEIHKVFANSPEGLGYSKTISYLRLGDENLIAYSIFNLDDIDLEILFYDDKISSKYQKYQEFVSFLSFKPLYLLYNLPNSFNWYRRKVESISLGKTEVDHDDSILHCPFKLNTLTFWEDNNINSITVSRNLEGDGKIYPIEYPFKYGSLATDHILLTSKGMLASPLEITINGTVANPQIILYNSDDEVYGRTKLNGVFDKVYINSEDSNEKLELTRGGLLLDNPLGFQDLTIGSPNEVYITFLKLQTGTSYIRFVLDDDFDGDVQIKWRNRYVSV